MIRDAIAPERLEEFKKLMEGESKTPEQRAADLDAKLRAELDALAESEDRSRFEKRRARV